MPDDMKCVKCERLEAEVERLRKDYEVALRVMAGVLSTKDGWTDKHPQEAYEYIRAAIDAVKGEQK